MLQAVPLTPSYSRASWCDCSQSHPDFCPSPGNFQDSLLAASFPPGAGGQARRVTLCRAWWHATQPGMQHEQGCRGHAAGSAAAAPGVNCWREVPARGGSLGAVAGGTWGPLQHPPAPLPSPGLNARCQGPPSQEMGVQGVPSARLWGWSGVSPARCWWGRSLCHPSCEGLGVSQASLLQGARAGEEPPVRGWGVLGVPPASSWTFPPARSQRSFLQGAWRSWGSLPPRAGGLPLARGWGFPGVLPARNGRSCCEHGAGGAGAPPAPAAGTRGEPRPGPGDATRGVPVPVAVPPPAPPALTVGRAAPCRGAAAGRTRGTPRRG